MNKLIADLRENPRLRIGLAFIVGILWLYWLLGQQEHNDALRLQYTQQASQLARLSSGKDELVWLKREQEAKVFRLALESRLWQKSSLGLAQAEVQDWLNQQLLQAKVIRPMARISESAEPTAALQTSREGGANTPPGVQAIRARVEFDFAPKALNDVLIALSTTRHSLVVESINVTPPKVGITLIAHALIAQSTKMPPASKTGTQ